MGKSRSAFHQFLEDTVREKTEYLRQHGWLKPEIGGPQTAAIEPLIQPYLGIQEVPPPPAVETAVYMSVRAGAAHEALGDLQAALAWYVLGQYFWRGSKQFRAVTEDPPDFARRETAGELQLKAAICADRVGNTERASALYIWAAENRTLTSGELDEFVRTRQYQPIWEWLPYRAYALSCLERWDEALAVAAEAQRWVDKDRRAQTKESYQAPLRILPVVLALARFKMDPSGENRRGAQELLDPQAVASRSHPDHLLALFYLYNLRARHPELAHPPPAELTAAEAARQGAEACRQWMAHGGVQLDGTPESLQRLDQHMREIYRAARDEEERKTFLFLWGSYVGEVVRQELAGGKWQFAGQDLLGSNVEWDMGEVELHLWAFQHVYRYATGDTKQTLYELWRETEQAYIDHGLAARYAD